MSKQLKPINNYLTWMNYLSFGLFLFFSGTQASAQKPKTDCL